MGYSITIEMPDGLLYFNWEAYGVILFQFGGLKGYSI